MTAVVMDVEGDKHAASIARARRQLIWLSGLSIVGLAAELATLRHWDNPVQLIAWAALVVLAVGWGIVASRPAGALLRTGRVLLILVVVTSVVGTWRHALANFEAGPLHRDFASTWQTMSGWSQWWAALTKQVGPAAPLTPLALALVAVLVVIAAALDAPSKQP